MWNLFFIELWVRWCLQPVNLDQTEVGVSDEVGFWVTSPTEGSPSFSKSSSDWSHWLLAATPNMGNRRSLTKPPFNKEETCLSFKALPFCPPLEISSFSDCWPVFTCNSRQGLESLIECYYLGQIDPGFYQGSYFSHCFLITCKMMSPRIPGLQLAVLNETIGSVHYNT